MSARHRYPGRPASPGTALGHLHRTDRPFPVGAPDDPAGDGRTDAAPRPPGPCLAAAFDQVADRMDAVAGGLRTRGENEQADIIEVGALIARDPELRQHAVRLAAAGSDAAAAVRDAVDTQARAIAALGDPVLAERAADVRQVGRRVLAVLHGVHEPPPERPLVLAAREIGAADLLEPGRMVTAALSVTGGPNSHAAIVARSSGIPLLLGVDPGVLDLPDGVQVLVDADSAVVHPVAEERATALAAIAALRERRARLAAARHLPARTVDGHPVTLRVNAATPADVRAGLEAGADGVGLLRTELPFLDAARWPSRARHTIALGPVLAPLAGRTATVRTLDFADDKLPPFLAEDRGADRRGAGAAGGTGGPGRAADGGAGAGLAGGAGAGLAGADGGAGGSVEPLVGRRAPGGAVRRIGRGLPLMLARPDAFGEQFTALLGAAAGARVELRVMIPMVADVGELRACRALLDRAAAELDLPAPPLGIMVELPEAVRRIGELAAEAAFLSLGTNDLTCQLLGLDRRDPAAGPASTAHPAVLRAIAAVVAAARAHRRPVSVCGDAAAHPLVLPLLVGLGCDTLSVAPAALDEVRAAVRGLDHGACRKVATEALALRTAEEVRHLVHGRLPVPPG
ncbi:putative phosphoenolpyruvate-protein phosphotransferase [Actinacidiphila reveromycinica]|uniref:Phosphoenolpyruvate-protein phosphotransferase n=1 Tax=Actinacidiphila reveromycinica TaxID=659352 RepID=A0A7U3VS96_9ACTN|nr:putative PEP-binding protein [Streptomyces sp. SN-593]BBB01549.1 putative phosphoenolpyruvate-protein phosphotransferase [Streptomyces sp. SN-593]